MGIHSTSLCFFSFFFSSRRRHTRCLSDWSSDVCSSDLELRDPTADGALISRRLGLTARAWQLALRRRYAYFAGPYSALEVQPLRGVRGVHLEPVLNRFYPDPAVARATIGRLGDDGLGASGLERTVDTLLAGPAGAAVVL